MTVVSDDNPAAHPPPRNVFLVGPMGVGKTTIGRCLADLLHKEFVDLDVEIEKRTGASIPLIFEIEGEEGFRRREAALLDEITGREDLVLATGGGAVLASGNRERLRERGVVVYLSAPVETLLERTARDRHRPLLQTPDRRKTLEEILRAREPLYRETAHLVVKSSSRAPALVAREIIKQLEGVDRDANT
jgi:shikimate kinase